LSTAIHTELAGCIQIPSIDDIHDKRRHPRQHRRCTRTRRRIGVFDRSSSTASFHAFASKPGPWIDLVRIGGVTANWPYADSAAGSWRMTRRWRHLLRQRRPRHRTDLPASSLGSRPRPKSFPAAQCALKRRRSGADRDGRQHIEHRSGGVDFAQSGAAQA
jgi:hypothetical protein